MADEHDLETLLGVATALDMHFAHQRAGGVDHLQATAGGALLDPARHAVRGEHRHRALRHLVDLRDEAGALRPKVLDHALVVDDLVPDVDGRAVALQRPLHGLDGPLDAGAEAARLGEQDFQRSFGVRSSTAFRPSIGPSRRCGRTMPAPPGGCNQGRAGRRSMASALRSAQGTVLRERHIAVDNGRPMVSTDRLRVGRPKRARSADRLARQRRTLKIAGNRGPYGSGRSSRTRLDRASAVPGTRRPDVAGLRSLGRSRSTALFTRIGEAALGACAAMARRRPWVVMAVALAADRRRRLRLDGAHRQHLDGGHPLAALRSGRTTCATAAFFRARSW